MGTVDGRTAVVVDDHPLWVEACANRVARLGIELVGSTASPTEALTLVREYLPDLLVTGLEFSDGKPDGLTFLRWACEAHPGLKSVVFSASDDPVQIEDAFAAGATIVCVKTSDPDVLSSAIRQAFALTIFFANGWSPTSATASAPSVSQGIAELTRRELEILQLVAEGFSNSQLAKMLWVTEQTVKFHLSNIYRKLAVSNRTEASRWAQVHGLLASEPQEPITVS